MIGFEIRMARLFEKGRAFVVALDHGLVMGPLKGIENPIEIVSKIAKNGPDALQMTPSMAKIVKENFFSRNSPLLIARLDTTNTFRKDYKPYNQGYYSSVYTIKDAINCYADAVVTYLVVGYGDDGVEGYNISKLAELRKEANDYGIPFIIEPLYVTKDSSDSVREINLVKYVTRLASEIGADILKVDYTGNKEDFREVVKVAFSPILIRGGPKTNTNEEFLKMLKDALDAGARGITVGRNLWQSNEPDKLARAISKIVHENVDIGEALKILK